MLIVFQIVFTWIDVILFGFFRFQKSTGRNREVSFFIAEQGKANKKTDDVCHRLLSLFYCSIQLQRGENIKFSRKRFPPTILCGRSLRLNYFCFRTVNPLKNQPLDSTRPQDPLGAISDRIRSNGGRVDPSNFFVLSFC